MAPDDWKTMRLRDLFSDDAAIDPLAQAARGQRALPWTAAR